MSTSENPDVVFNRLRNQAMEDKTADTITIKRADLAMLLLAYKQIRNKMISAGPVKVLATEVEQRPGGREEEIKLSYNQRVILSEFKDVDPTGARSGRFEPSRRRDMEALQQLAYMELCALVHRTDGWVIHRLTVKGELVRNLALMARPEPDGFYHIFLEERR